MIGTHHALHNSIDEKLEHKKRSLTHELHTKGALLGLVAIVLSWQSSGIPVSIVIAKHTIDFRPRIVTEPKVLQHLVANGPASVPPPPGNATSVAAPTAVLIRLIAAIGRNPPTRCPLMGQFGPCVETASSRFTLTATVISPLPIRG